MTDKNNIVVYFNWDGFGKIYFDEALRRGVCPTIEKIISEGVVYDNAFTHIPSITNAMQPCIVSGTTPKYTDNHYRYFNKETKTVQQETPARLCRAEMIAEALKRQNTHVLSINQFTLENRGTTIDDYDYLYIVDPTKDGIKRFNTLYNYINDREAIDEIAPFIAFYADEIDSLLHNNRKHHEFEIAKSHDEKMNQIMTVISQFDEQLDRLLKLCKEKDFLKYMSFILTADHGMTSYGQDNEMAEKKQTSLYDVINTLSNLGLTIEALLPNEKVQNVNTDCVITGVGLQLNVSYLNKTDEQIDVLNKLVIEKLQEKPYYGKSMTYRELMAHGCKRGFADLVISPKPGDYFKPKEHEPSLYAQGQHDSLDDSSQRIPILLWGNNIKKNKRFDTLVFNSNVAVTLTTLLNRVAPIDATQDALWDALTISKPLFEKNEYNFSSTYFFEIGTNKVEFEYKSMSDEIIVIKINDFEYDMFFPNSHGNIERKVMNYQFNVSDVLAINHNDEVQFSKIVVYENNNYGELMIRKITNEDFKYVSKLVDATFQPKESMRNLFPNLFVTNEKFSYVQEIDKEIVSFIGVSPIVYNGFYGVSIGAVCTDRRYQGKGLMRQMFPEVIKDLKLQGIDFILVSGGGKVYRENGTQDFGCFNLVKINGKKLYDDITMIEYKNDLKGLKCIHKAINKGNNFDYGITELSILLESQSVSRLTGFRPITYYLDDSTFLTYAYKERTAQVIEYEGDFEKIEKMILTLNFKFDIDCCEIVVNENVDVSKYDNIRSITNSSTIISFNESLDTTSLPFCRGYKFI